MMAPGESFSQSYPASADSVPRARTELTAFAANAGATGEQLEAVRLASSEAVTNAVLHAYRGSGGTIQVTAWYVPGELWVLVADDGSGLQVRRDRRGLGLGLALIAQMADEFEVLSRSSGGTELRMRFRLRPPPRSRSDQSRGSVSAAAAPA
jgi:anti-sigma regulatory factor (Ser/Thr protein kinase)